MSLVLRQLHAIKLEVPRYPKHELHRRARDWFNASSPGGVVSHTATDSQLARIYVNFLRHECMPYDLMMDIANGNLELQHYVRKAVYRAIVGVYPWLVHECTIQLTKRSD